MFDSIKKNGGRGLSMHTIFFIIGVFAMENVHPKSPIYLWFALAPSFRNFQVVHVGTWRSCEDRIGSGCSISHTHVKSRAGGDSMERSKWIGRNMCVEQSVFCSSGLGK
jgi:hypothetical protein